MNLPHDDNDKDNDNNDSDRASVELIRRIADALKQSGAPALDGDTPDAAAHAWLDAGLDDAEEVAEWLAARCFNPRVAQSLDAAGITPAQAALVTQAGRADYAETIAYKLAAGDLTLEEARRIITSDFWNS